MHMKRYLMQNHKPRYSYTNGTPSLPAQRRILIDVTYCHFSQQDRFNTRF